VKFFKKTADLPKTRLVNLPFEWAGFANPYRDGEEPVFFEKKTPGGGDKFEDEERRKKKRGDGGVLLAEVLEILETLVNL